MELLKGLGGLLIYIGVWLLFVSVFADGLGIGAARYSAWWAPGQKVQTYVTIRSKWLACLLVARYSGYNDKIRTNIGVLYNRFYLNRYPERISYFGIFDWCVSLPLTGWWTFELTRSFFVRFPLGKTAGNGLPAAALALMLYRIVMHFASIWNNAKAEVRGPSMTKAELKVFLKEQK